MNNNILVLVFLFSLSACAAGQEDSIYDEVGFLNLFNSFYYVPEADLDNTCLVDVKLTGMGEEGFLATLDRIIEDTGNGILYSNLVRRDRVIYVVSVACNELGMEHRFSAQSFFGGNLEDFAHAHARGNSLITTSMELDFSEIKVDLNRAAFSAELLFSQPLNNEEADKQSAALFCVLESSQKTYTDYSLPFVYIAVKDNSLVYIYNMYKEEPLLIRYLVEEGLEKCGVEYQFEVRALNEGELEEFSRTFVFVEE